MLTLPHFHSKLRRPLDSADTIDHCLAEYLFPETEFSLGIVYDKGTQPEDLRGYEDKSLQFSSGDRMYFGSQEVGEQLYPKPSDRTAYGNLPFTPCLSMSQVKARVLIVDDETGANGGLFDEDWAKKWVGDCFGRISGNLCREVTGQITRPFQFRLGIKPQEECPVYRIAKGTLAPCNLTTLVPNMEADGEQAGNFKADTGFDLILPVSSFKGRKGEEAIEPGAYNLTLGIGVKTLANYRPHSLGTQVLVNYPHAVKEEILPRLAEQAKELAAAQQDIVGLAKYYVDTYERQQQKLRGEEQEGDWSELGGLAAAIDAAFGTSDMEQREERLLYTLLKHDVDHHCQLLEHPHIIDQLRHFVRRRWLDIATGRAIKFQAGLAQSSLNLQEDEVWIPGLPEGAEVIVSRSPLLNSNGVLVLKNRSLPEAQKQEGGVYIHPDTAARHMQADFDGDFLFFAPAADYPVLAEEITQALTPERRYPDVVKQDKQPYTGSFEEIACAAQENQIGIIANQIQRTMALRWECRFLPENERQDYLKDVQKHYRKLTPDNVPEQFRERWQQMCRLPSNISPDQAEAAATTLDSILLDVVGELSNQLQIAADGPKSAQRPNQQILDYCTALSGYRDVSWIGEKKRPDVYHARPIACDNNSPIDWMIEQANSYYQDCALTPQPLVTFRALFQGVEYSPDDERIARTIKSRYNELAARASRLQERARNQNEPVLMATSATSGRTITIEHILDYADENQAIWCQEPTTIQLRRHPRYKGRLEAVALSDKGQKLFTIGTLSTASQREYGLHPGSTLTGARIEMDTGVTEAEVEAAWNRLAEYVDSVREQFADKDKRPLAAALWHLSHPAKKDLSGKANAVMAIFPEAIMERLEERHLDHLKVVGIQHPTNAHVERFWQGEEVSLAIVRDNNPDSPLYHKRVVQVNGETLASLAKDSPHLPLGVTGRGRIVTQPGARVTITSARGNTLTLKKANQYHPLPWQGEERTLTVERLGEKNAWVLCCDGQPIGELDKDSVATLARQGLLQEGRELPKLSLQSSPATTAVIELLPETLNYQRDKEPEVAEVATEDGWVVFLDKQKQGIKEQAPPPFSR